MEKMCAILNGHSGCCIQLMEDDSGQPFVRKISSKESYNERLKKQCEKQETFQHKAIKAPLVLNQGYTEEMLFYFDMEYVRGITLAEYIKLVNVSSIRGIVKDIIRNALIIGGKDESYTKRSFDKKIYELMGYENLMNNKVYSDAITLLEKHDWSAFTQSFCHGDYTLENIIVHNEELYLIDFLDSFYDCWILDIATLLQDVQCMWSYRFDKNLSSNAKIRLIIFRDILMEQLCRSDIANLKLEVYYALILKLVRIYPYTSDDETFLFLEKNLLNVMQIVKQIQDI